MTDRDPMAGEQAAAEKAPEQQAAAAWPKPGEEGYVHPDGTPQAAAQLEANRQAAADRAAAGSTVHGAPAATNEVSDPGAAAGLAEKRAEDYSGPTQAEHEQGVTDFVTEKSQEAAAEQRAAAAEQDRTAEPKAAKSDTGKQQR